MTLQEEIRALDKIAARNKPPVKHLSRLVTDRLVRQLAGFQSKVEQELGRPVGPVGLLNYPWIARRQVGKLGGQ